MKRQAGFTIIELVMVIVILGILSAFALPRFADLGTGAKIASLNGLAGALKSAASIAHAEQLVAGSGLGDPATLEGASVAMVNGYPQANAAGILRAADVTATDYTVAGGGATGGSAITFTLDGVDCTVTYTAATATTDNTGPISGSYTVTALTSLSAPCGS